MFEMIRFIFFPSQWQKDLDFFIFCMKADNIVNEKTDFYKIKMDGIIKKYPSKKLFLEDLQEIIKK